MTNPDNVGGQKPLIPRLKCLASLLQQLNAQTACQAVNDAIAEIELCRAAPAGGEPKAPVFPSAVGPAIHEVGQAMWLLPDGADKARARLKNAMDLLRALQHIPPVDSAPAGPGEVGEVADWLDRAAAKWSEGPMAINWADADRMRNAAALLRKLQQGAEPFVSCTCHEERQKALCLKKHRCVRAYPLASQGQEGGHD